MKAALGLIRQARGQRRRPIAGLGKNRLHATPVQLLNPTDRPIGRLSPSVGQTVVVLAKQRREEDEHARPDGNSTRESKLKSEPNRDWIMLLLLDHDRCRTVGRCARQPAKQKATFSFVRNPIQSNRIGSNRIGLPIQLREP